MTTRVTVAVDCVQPNGVTTHLEFRINGAQMAVYLMNTMVWDSEV
jgi:hypothetical protein